MTAQVRNDHHATMMRGNVFEKHGRRGAPGLRFVRLSNDLRRIDYYHVKGDKGYVNESSDLVPV